MVIVPHSLWGDDVVSQPAIVPPLNDTDVVDRERGATYLQAGRITTQRDRVSNRCRISYGCKTIMLRDLSGLGEGKALRET